MGKRNSIGYGHFIGEDAINMFSIKILDGDKNPLHDPYSIVLTDETAKILFGNENPIGKMVKLDNEINLKVTAVVNKQPKNSSLSYDYLIPFPCRNRFTPGSNNTIKQTGEIIHGRYLYS